MIKKSISILLLSVILVTMSCNNDDDNTPAPPTTSDLVLDIEGLEALGDDFVYEGWIIVDGTPVSTGVFSSVNFPQSFTVETSDLDNATRFVLSIEPTIDPDPAPASTKILVGDFSGNSANINSKGTVADFNNASGTYILATPTDGNGDINEESGVWFLDNSSGSPVAGLNLPALADGWKYEGWAVIDGTPISTGTFLISNGPDDNASTSAFKGDDNDGPPFPGEDFLQNAPSGLTFPTDLKGKTIVISVEPYPDNNPDPFTLKPLAHMVPENAENHTAIMMGDGPVSIISGTVTR